MSVSPLECESLEDKCLTHLCISLCPAQCPHLGVSPNCGPMNVDIDMTYTKFSVLMIRFFLSKSLLIKSYIEFYKEINVILVTFFCLFFSSGPNRGHYITIVKSHGFWLLFDDDIVEVSMQIILQ